MTEAELHEWLSKMNIGDKEAFEMIYKETRKHVYRTIPFLLRNKQDVCDVVSEVYIELFKSTQIMIRSISRKVDGRDNVYYSRNTNNFLSKTGVFQEIT